MVDERADNPTDFERGVVTLARAAFERPRRLSPKDLEPLRAVAGDGALDYALVLSMFHFINRIADLLNVNQEVLPASLQRIELLRRLSVRVTAKIMQTMDLATRPFDSTYPETVERIQPLLVKGISAADCFESIKMRPKIIDQLRLILEGWQASSLATETLARIPAMVEAALPANLDEAEGIQQRPANPLEAFVFVGTRYAQRTTPVMIDALRGQGYDDEMILDLAIAVADANQWSRLHRLLGLPAELLHPNHR